TVVFLLGREFLGVLLASIRDPIVTATAGPSFGPPWWVGIAIQGHLLGFLLGVLLGALILTRRQASEIPSAIRLWAGTLVAGSGLTLWAIWWYRGPSRFVLYRGLGLIILLLLATLVAGAIRTEQGELVSGIGRREVAIAVLALPILTMGFVAVPINLTSVGGQPVPGEPIEVREYTVTYAENVPNQKTRTINLSVFGETTRVNASGVIVVNPERGIWTERVSAGRLAQSGRATIKLGGLFWSRTVRVQRRGWTVVGGGTTYRVIVTDPRQNRSGTFISEPVTASPVLAGRNVTLVAGRESFRLNVSLAGKRLATAPIPAMNESVTLGGIRFIRREGGLIAAINDTRIRIAKPESYA
ncbi:MAG: rhomboid-like intramembrane serine protease, partial [Halodesulfurarchaeum sp.]